MIVWSGKGFLIIVVLIATLFLGISILPSELADYGFIASLFISGIFSWIFGKKWNSNNQKILIDEETGEKILLKGNHSLFWIPMQYWSVILGVLGIIIMFQNSVIFAIISSIILIGMIVFQFTKNRTKNGIEQTNSIKPVENEVKKKEKAEKEKIEREKIRKEKENPNRFMP